MNCPIALRSVALLVVLLGSLSPMAAQQPPFALGPPVPLDSSEPEEPEIAALPDGSFFVTWWSSFSGVPIPGGVFTMGQRLGADGSQLTKPFSLTGEIGGPRPADVAVDASGTPVVLFEGGAARAYTAFGIPLAPSFPVFPSASPFDTSLAAGPGGDLVAMGSGDRAVHLTRFTASGSIRFEHRQPARNVGGDITRAEARAAILTDGETVLGVWERREGVVGDVYVYRLAPDGTVAAEVFTGATVDVLELGALPDGRLLVATNDAPGVVTVRILSRDLAVESVLGGLAVGSSLEVDLAVQPDGEGFALAWVNPGNLVEVQRYDLQGRPVGPPVLPSVDLPGGDPVPPLEFDREPRIAFSPNGVLAAVWWREGDAGPLPPVRGGASGEPTGDAGATRIGSVGAYFRAVTAACPSDLLCFQANRFTARVSWRDPRSGDTGIATPVPVTDDTGVFWFFQAENLELMLKVLDGRLINDHFWVFYGSLTDVAYELTVTDRLTGRTEVYVNPPFNLGSRGDTRAFRETIR